jgi:hypothetical protein
MSLQLLAKQMEAKGRKGDSMLVHMTPEEVAGLQKLAESAGGSLSVNPETGLVEANFLKRMLPTLVGIGVGIGTGNPFLGAAAGAAVGGYQAKENKQDVLFGAAMGGLGGYGGAGLGAGLTAAGGTTAANVAGQQAATLSAEELAKKQAAEELAKQAAADEATRQAARQATEQAAVAEGLKTSGAEAAQNVLQNQAAAAGAEGTIGEAAAQQTVQQAAAQPTVYTYPEDGSTLSVFRDGTTTSTPGTDVVVAKPKLTVGERFSQAGRGIGQMGTEEGQAEFAKKFGMKQAMAGAAPAMAPGKLEKPEEFVEDDEMYYTEYTPGQTGERSSTSTEARQFAGTYSPMEKIKAADYTDRVRRRSIYAAEGGLMRLAEGGDVAGSGVTASGMAPSMYDAPTMVRMGGVPVARQVGLPALMEQTPARAQPVSANTPRASSPALAYLMGQTSQSPAMMANTAEPAQVEARSDRMYLFNPATGAFTKNPNYEDPAAKPASDGIVGDSFNPVVDMTSRYDQTYYAQRANHEGGNAAGGLLSLAKGGMKSGGFVIPADVVSMVGEGNTDAGYSRIKSMVPGATAIKGKDGGQADTVKTSIEGKQPARVAHGEMYVPPETVKRMGGAKKLYAMMDKVRAQATGSKKQIKPVSLKKALA